MRFVEGASVVPVEQELLVSARRSVVSSNPAASSVFCENMSSLAVRGIPAGTPISGNVIAGTMSS